MRALSVSPQQVAVDIVEIIDLVASHTEAEVGTVVSVQVTLRGVNETYSPWPVMPTLTVVHPVSGATNVPLRNNAGDDWVNLEFVHVESFIGSFIMPSAGVTLYARAFHLWGPYGGEYWNEDDIKSLGVNLVGAPPSEYVGTITREQLRHDSTQSDIPVDGVPLNEGAILYIYARNDTSTIQRMGIDWVIGDPDGVEVQRYSNWQIGYTNPGSEVGFSGPVFQLTKPGQYIYYVQLLMNPSVPEVVDNTTDIRMCMVASGYAGAITRKQLRHDSTQSNIPASVPLDEEAILYIYGRNDTALVQRMGVHWWVYDPDNEVVEEYLNWQAGYTNPGSEVGFSGGVFQLTKPGQWVYHAQLLMNEPNPVVVDTIDDPNLCMVTGSYAGRIIDQWVSKGASSFMPLPASVAVDNETFEVGARYINDSTVQIYAGIEVTVTDPEGTVRLQVPGDRAVDWAWMAPGANITVNHNVSVVDKAGSWTVLLRFVMLDGTELARWEGVCLDAIGATGVITEVQFNKSPEGNRQPTGPTVEVTANRALFELNFFYKNTSSFTLDNAGVEIIVRDPDGEIRASPAVAWADMVADYTKEHQYNCGPVDKAGAWTVHVEFKLLAGLVLHTMNFTCFTAIGLAGEIEFGYINWGTVIRGTLPRTVEAAGHSFEVGARYTNKGSYDIVAGIKVELWDPAGSLRPMQTGIDWAGMGPDAMLDHDYNMGGILDIEGEWTGLITFLTEGGEVLDTFPKTGVGVLFTTTPEVEPPDPTGWELAITNYNVTKGAV